MTNIVINKNENKPVIMKLVYRVKLNLVSPVCVSSGHEGVTDSDVIRDYDGNPFIPGTSLAGAFREYITSDKEMVFGDADSKMSSLFISDLTFDSDINIDYRDSVKLSEDKISEDGAKFDFEVVECENAHFFMELTIRKNDDEKDFIKKINEIFVGIQNHEIRLGSKKTRGYGIIEINEIRNKEFTEKNYIEYANCYNDNYEKWELYAQEIYKNDSHNKQSNSKELSYDNQWIHVKVPLKQRGGISIRKYLIQTDDNDNENLPDYESLTNCKGNPVIPGTSFSGAIRHRVLDILKSLEGYSERAYSIVNEMFGFVNIDNKSDQSYQSRIVFDEAMINGFQELVTVRNSVSRFEGATVNGALYKEKTYVGGNLELKFAVKKSLSSNKSHEEEWILGLVLLAIKDLQNGFLAVGGQTAVGRGLFEKNGEIEIDGEEGLEDMFIISSLQTYKSQEEDR